MRLTGTFCSSVLIPFCKSGRKYVNVPGRPTQHLQRPASL
ncbi:hypothetical protein CLOSTASPAR_01890 [[Clostridium] asparagiforme DSM 15981]|uniref:Uncharacterized protein n=1 Tax=[Clostridium] asparagiforme DSM 15981 TaxID=518636 RepID=C0CY13_9FIRM|nr:hypothetical protein CLOSTASPAR_01890 [[Clostridium] asparagiforme DSM 15981]